MVVAKAWAICPDYSTALPCVGEVRTWSEFYWFFPNFAAQTLETAGPYWRENYRFIAILKAQIYAPSMYVLNNFNQ